MPIWIRIFGIPKLSEYRFGIRTDNSYFFRTSSDEQLLNNLFRKKNWLLYAHLFIFIIVYAIYFKSKTWNKSYIMTAVYSIWITLYLLVMFGQFSNTPYFGQYLGRKLLGHRTDSDKFSSETGTTSAQRFWTWSDACLAVGHAMSVSSFTKTFHSVCIIDSRRKKKCTGIFCDRCCWLHSRNSHRSLDGGDVCWRAFSPPDSNLDSNYCYYLCVDNIFHHQDSVGRMPLTTCAV